jgi:hypothetical protein
MIVSQMDEKLRAAIEKAATAEGVTVDYYFDQLVAEALVVACSEGLRRGLGGKARGSELYAFAAEILPQQLGEMWFMLRAEIARKANSSLEAVERDVQLKIIERVISGCLS